VSQVKASQCSAASIKNDAPSLKYFKQPGNNKLFYRTIVSLKKNFLGK
jgi:hypothetical protein